MRIIGYDLQARQQTVAMLDTLSGELVNRIRHRTVPSSGSLASQISLSSPIRPSKTVPRLFARDTASGEERNIFTLHLVLYQGLHPVGAHSAERRRNVEPKPKKQRPENYQNGRERPHFSGFQPPKKSVGSLPPSSTRRDSCTVASTGESAEP
jgi:hypothetical protein